MRSSQTLLATVKETPADAELISHQLMFRAGLIRKLGSGLYTWLPTGLRVLRKVEQIVRKEMDPIAQEILMPAIQPASLWEETGRWNTFGPQLLSMTDRNNRAYCFGPTHEEVITDLMRKELKSYKQLPCCFYQIQTKFRDEIRPRFGVMRAREFTMKDAYSFHIDKISLQNTYDAMYEAYSRIFKKLGLTFRAVLADTGAIGGSDSHEFHVLADSGEDIIVYSTEGDYAANLEKAQSGPLPIEKPNQFEDKQIIEISNLTQASNEAPVLGLPASRLLKTILVRGTTAPVVAIILRSDHDLNLIKLSQLEEIASPLEIITENEILNLTGTSINQLGPLDLNLPILGDFAIEAMFNFACGANKINHYFKGLNWHRDLPLPKLVDIRNVVAGDPSPDGKGKLAMCRGIEVGHIFQLGDKYSQAMGARVLNDESSEQSVQMGCYGIGISRIVAAAIEQNHDERGIIWPDEIAPYDIVIIPMQYYRSEIVKSATDALYNALINAGKSVLLDDRNERPGVLFADCDLIGVPHRIVVGERSLKMNQIEYKHRRHQEATLVENNVEALLNFLNT